jgi:hypothetical protein
VPWAHLGEDSRIDGFNAEALFARKKTIHTRFLRAWPWPNGIQAEVN